MKVFVLLMLCALPFVAAGVQAPSDAPVTWFGVSVMIWLAAVGGALVGIYLTKSPPNDATPREYFVYVSSALALAAVSVMVGFFGGLGVEIIAGKFDLSRGVPREVWTFFVAMLWQVLPPKLWPFVAQFFGRKATEV